MKKIKLIKPQMMYNPLIERFEPELPLRKISKKIKRKRNWWAFWYIMFGG